MKNLIICLSALVVLTTLSSCGTNEEKKKPADDAFVLGDGRCNDEMLDAYNLATNYPTPQRCEAVRTGLNGRSCRAYSVKARTDIEVSYADLQSKCNFSSQQTQAPGVLKNGKCSQKTVDSTARMQVIGRKSQSANSDEQRNNLYSAMGKECKNMRGLLGNRSCVLPNGKTYSYSSIADYCKLLEENL